MCMRSSYQFNWNLVKHWYWIYVLINAGASWCCENKRHNLWLYHQILFSRFYTFFISNDRIENESTHKKISSSLRYVQPPQMDDFFYEERKREDLIINLSSYNLSLNKLVFSLAFPVMNPYHYHQSYQ